MINQKLKPIKDNDKKVKILFLFYVINLLLFYLY